MKWIKKVIEGDIINIECKWILMNKKLNSSLIIIFIEYIKIQLMYVFINNKETNRWEWTKNITQWLMDVCITH